MPGYAIYLATLTEKERENLDFVKGVLTPNILKKWYKIFNGDLSQVEEKYAKWAKNGNLPPFSAFEKRIAQKESLNVSEGMHYGMSSSPDLNAFFKDPVVDLSNPFWKGYLKHLITDLVLYRALDIEKILNNLWITFEKCPNAMDLYHAEVSKLYNDWDILNKLYINQYSILLPKEVLELSVVNFKTGKLVYVDKTIVDNVIYMLNQIHLG